MSRFVLLRHECPDSFHKPSHWDFMLEWGDALRTWDLRELPAGWAKKIGHDVHVSEVAATQQPDHRKAYLDYEGPLTGDRGSVHCCDRGEYELLIDDADKLEVRLLGEHLTNSIRLLRSDDIWLLTAF